jgi:hypothetical protein
MEPLGPLLDPGHKLTLCFCTIHFNIILRLYFGFLSNLFTSDLMGKISYEMSPLFLFMLFYDALGIQRRYSVEYGMIDE